MTEYNPTTCITVEELRSLGIHIEEKIPDCAWIPRWSVKMEVGEVTMKDNKLAVEMNTTFQEPFQWIETTATLKTEY